MENFRKLGLNEDIIKALEESKFEVPSEIQEKTIPLVLQGKDVIAGSATGSGKTLAFGAGILQNTQRYGGIQSLILTPTRELAEQITKALKHFSKHNQLNIIPIYGGVSITKQIRELEKAEIVVGTPGRILDHLQRQTIDLSLVKILVLDEADRMLDMGFIDDVDKIITQCPKKRQTLLFSATISQDIAVLAKKYLQHPVEVSAESYIETAKLKQVYYDTPSYMKFSLLVHLLNGEKSGLVMVFCNTRRNADFVEKNLNLNGIEATAIHGGLTQDKRNRVLAHFHSQSVHVLVCTDVAARGLDIKGVSHIYNYDLPPSSKDYIHRIGRTARAGKEGKAISLVSERDYENFNHVLEDHSLEIFAEHTPNVEKVQIKIFDRGRGDSPRRSGNRSGGYGERSGGYGGRTGGYGSRPSSSGQGHRPRRSTGVGGSNNRSSGRSAPSSSRSEGYQKKRRY